jgi:1-acyl-sn-glycerol-3-phosphate acyltransferase
LLAFFRILVAFVFFLIVCISACFYSLLRPFHRNNVHLTAKYLGKVSKILGISVEVRIPESVKNMGPAVYICNHQDNYDLFTVSNALPRNTVSVGKSSLKWIPVFGQMYWLTGNILIDRKNSNKALNTIAQTVKKIKEKNLSVWLFPEGTRSKGRGLLPFKTGAFRTAQLANVPIIPICVSNQHGIIKFNRWNNGKIIIELLDPIYLPEEAKSTVRVITNETRALMATKVEQLDHEIKTKDKRSEH